MRSQLVKRLQNLINTIPPNDLYEFTQLAYQFIDERNPAIIQKFSTGDEVYWMNKKVKTDGTITKINHETGWAAVSTPENWKWDVPAYLLRKEKYLKGD
jgi:hypothetical protein